VGILGGSGWWRVNLSRRKKSKKTLPQNDTKNTTIHLTMTRIKKIKKSKKTTIING